MLAHLDDPNRKMFLGPDSEWHAYMRIVKGNEVKGALRTTAA